MMRERQIRWKEMLKGMDGGRLVKQVYEGEDRRNDCGRGGRISLNR